MKPPDNEMTAHIRQFFPELVGYISPWGDNPNEYLLRVIGYPYMEHGYIVPPAGRMSDGSVPREKQHLIRCVKAWLFINRDNIKDFVALGEL